MEFNVTTNLFNETTQEQAKWGTYFIDSTWRLSFAILHLCGALAATMLNGIVVMGMFKGNALKEMSCRILCALAITDFLTGISGFFNFSEAILTKMEVLSILINIRYSLNIVTLLSSILFATFISYDRFLQVSRLHSRWKMSCVWCSIGISICWAIPSITAILCHTIHHRAIWLLPGLVCLGSFLCMNVCYVLLLQSLRGLTKENKSSSLDAQYINNEKYAARTIIIIMTFFLGMNFPIVIGVIIRAGIGLNTPLAQYNAIGVFLSFSNSIVNPIVYSIRTRSIRRDILSLMPNCWTKNVVDSGSSVNIS